MIARGNRKTTFFFIIVEQLPIVMQRHYHPRQITNEATSNTPSEHPVVRYPVPNADLNAITTDTRTENLMVDVYRNQSANWIKVNAFYDCQCGRYIGYVFQQPLEYPTNPIPTLENRVIDITTPPPPPPVNETAITISSGNDSIVSIASSSSSSLLVEVSRLSIPSDESMIDANQPENSISTSSSSGKTHKSAEPMSVDTSIWSNEA